MVSLKSRNYGLACFVVQIYGILMIFLSFLDIFVSKFNNILHICVFMFLVQVFIPPSTIRQFLA
jgi:hypothetical protein